MTLCRMLRPALVYATVLSGGAALTSCSAVEGDANRFESMAQHVADIRLDGSAPASPHSAEQGHMRPAISRAQPLKVELMDPHDLWDARDGGLRGAMGQIGNRVAEVAAPAVADAVVQRASLRIAEEAPMRLAIPVEAAAVKSPSSHRESAARMVQLGAYSSPAAARVAWSKMSGGVAGHALVGLSPVYEAVEVNGRSFTRLKIAAPASSAAAICQAAAVSDPWCARRA